MKSALIIHGLSGHVKENWFPWLKQTLESSGWNVVLPNLPNAGHPVVDEWNEALTALVKDFDEHSVIVGHSLGAPAGLNLVQTLGKKIDKLVMVAPVNPLQNWSELKKNEPDLDWEAVKSFAYINFEWQKISSLVNKIIFYYSDNDPYIPENSMDFFKEHLPQAEFKLMSGKGHFNRSSGIIQLPEILENFE